MKCKKQERPSKNRGTAFSDLDRIPTALADHDKAVATYTCLVEREGRSDLAINLALSLTNRGEALKDLGKLRESLADHDKAVVICTHLWSRGMPQGAWSPTSFAA